jgi:hypothetical protein
MKKLYGYNWEDNHNLFESFLEKLEDGLQVIYNATINKIFDKRTDQKINVHIDNYDAWSADDTLAHIIYPLLKKVKEDKRGSSWVDDIDVPKALRNKKVVEDAEHPDHDSLIIKRWDYVIDEMIWAFESKASYNWSSQYYNEPNDKFKCDYEGLKAHQDRMSNGFRLFGVYFESLWT